MPNKALQILVGRAVISDDFRRGLLSDRRAELIRSADLTTTEAGFLKSIQAETFEEFAAAIERYVRLQAAPDTPAACAASLDWDSYVWGHGSGLARYVGDV